MEGGSMKTVALTSPAGITREYALPIRRLRVVNPDQAVGPTIARERVRAERREPKPTFPPHVEAEIATLVRAECERRTRVLAQARADGNLPNPLF
jgi:hypothetical protein